MNAPTHTRRKTYIAERYSLLSFRKGAKMNSWSHLLVCAWRNWQHALDTDNGSWEGMAEAEFGQNLQT